MPHTKEKQAKAKKTREGNPSKSRSQGIAKQSHLQSRTLAANLLRAERGEVLVQRIDGPAALDKLDHTPDIPIGPHNHNSAVLLAQAHLDVSGGLGLGHADVEDVVGVHVVVVARQELRQQLADLDVGPVGVEDCREGEEVGVRVVFFQVVDGGDVGALVG